MGSAVLGEAISAIRDWSEKRGKETSASNGKGSFGSLVFNDAAQQKRLPKTCVRCPAPDDHPGRGARPLGRGRRRVRAEGLGDRERRHPLHALVPAAHRHHSGKARLVPRAGDRWQGRLRILRQGARQGRAGCVELPVRRHALHLRGARVHGVGSHQPPVAAEARQRDDARHSDRVPQLDGRSARQEDAAAPLDGGAVEAGGPRAEAFRVQRRSSRDDVWPRAGILPDRPQLLSISP